MLRKLWKERPPTPVILAWMTAGMLAFIILGSAAYALVCLVSFLAG